MRTAKYLFMFLFTLIMSSAILAQTENTVKEKKVKLEKKVEKFDHQAKELKKEMKSHPEDCDCDACKTASAMKDKHPDNCDCDKCVMADKMHDHSKEMKEKHSEGCTCGMCSVKSEMKDKTKNVSHSHPEGCDCEGCKVAKAEIKKMKAHGKECTCEGCAKS